MMMGRTECAERAQTIVENYECNIPEGRFSLMHRFPVFGFIYFMNYYFFFYHLINS